MTSDPINKSTSNDPAESIPEIVRLHRWVTIALTITSLYYGATGVLNILPSFGPCGSSDWPVIAAIAALVAIKLFSLTSFVRLSDRLKDPVILSIIQFILIFLPFADLPILVITAY